MLATAPAHRRFVALIAGFALSLVGVAVTAPPAAAAPPANDNLASATAITPSASPTAVVVDNTEATREGGEPGVSGVTNCGAGTGGPSGRPVNSVWFTYTATISRSVQLETTSNPAATDTVVAAYTGPESAPTSGSLALVGCSDDTTVSNVRSDLRFDVVAGTTYYLQVGTFSLATVGSFELRFKTAPPVNDALASAATATLGVMLRPNNVDATLESGEAAKTQPGCATLKNSIWYQYTPGATGSVRAETVDNVNRDTVVRVWSGPSSSPTIAGLTAVSCNDDIGGSNVLSATTFTATGGTTYYFQVGTFKDTPALVGSDPGPGAFRFRIVNPAAAPPANDLIEDASTIAGTSGTTNGTTVNATTTPGELGESLGWPSVWYSWTAPISALVDFTTSANGDPGADTVLAAYTVAPGTGDLEQVDQGDDTFSTLFSVVTFEAVAGTSYRILVATKAAAPFTLNFGYRPPDNDDRADATTLTGPIGNTTGNYRFATHEATDPDLDGGSENRTVWYYWVAPADDGYSFETTLPGGGDSVLGVLQIPPVGEPLLVAQNDDIVPLGDLASRLDFPALEGESFFIVVNGLTTGAAGDFELAWAPYPATETTTTATPSVTDDVVDLAVTVAPNEGALVPTGSIEVFEGATSLGVTPTTDGTETIQLTGVSPGAHTFNVVYTSDDYHLAGSSSGDVAATVTLGSSTQLTATALNQTVQLSATVAASLAGYTPGGSVEFFEGATSRGVVALAGGVAATTLNGVSPGSHTYRAVYTPADAGYTTSTSPDAAVTVVAPPIVKVASKTTVAAPAKAKAGTRPTISVTVKRGAAAATGKVRVTLNGKVLKTLTLKNGKATLKLSALKKGTATIVATYLGNATTKPSTAKRAIKVAAP